MINMESLTKDAKSKLQKILTLNNQLGTDSKKLIEMMHHHIEEIKQLYDKKDKHFAIETGDLIILCLELLIKEGYSVDEIMKDCYLRFDDKLNKLINTKYQKTL